MFRRPRLLTVEDGMSMTMLVMFKVRCHFFVDDKNNIVVILLFLLLLIRLPLCDRPFISLLFDDLGTYCRCCRCNTDIQMALSGNHTFPHERPWNAEEKQTPPIILVSSQRHQICKFSGPSFIHYPSVM